VLFAIFFVVILYLGFLDWKKTLITKISSESTRFIGQDVSVGDLSLSLFKGVTLEDINIKNPQGFDSGNLLRIKKLYLKTRYRDLVGGTFHFDRIDVTSPELTLTKDKNGHVNISEKLKNVFKGEGKSEQKYHIKELTIKSGVFDFRHEKRYGINDINLSIQDISYISGTKTLINGSISYAGENTVDFEGWAYLKDEKKTFAVAVSSEGFNPGILREIFKKYKVNIDRRKFTFSIHAEGDTEEQVQFTSKIHIAGAQSDFLNKDLKYIQIDTSGMFNISEDTLNIKSLSLRADHAVKAQVRATIKDIRKAPLYDVTLRINKIDLSAFNLVPDFQTGGVVTADTIHVKGGLKNDEIRLSGGVRCTDCALKSDADDIKMKSETSAPPSDTYEAVQDETEGTDKSDETATSTVKMPYNIAAGDIKCSLKGTIGVAGYHGHGTVDAKGISVSKTNDERNILKDAFLNSEFTFRGNDIVFKAGTRTGKIAAEVSGTVKEFQKEDRSIAMQAHLPEIKTTDIRNSLWDIFPDSLLYAGLEGEIASAVSVDYTNGALGVTGDIQLKNVFLKGENNEYAVGPINGTVPLAYSNNKQRKKSAVFPSFERSEYDNLLQYYSRETTEGDYQRITIGSLTYGFRLLENITLMVRQQEGVFNIRYVNANIFGGKLDGFALVVTSEGLSYRAGMLIKGLSLTKLCDGITPIRGYISGKVDGIAQIKGSGAGLAQLIGKADFWTYKTEDEETTISKEFLQQVGGASVKTYLGDRAYDKGILGLYIKDGFIIFRELEISNRNLVGVKDLSVKVVPLNNKISIENLMWTIIEASHRAKKK
jgi:hypothetical protein